jgi:type VI secretion system protein ImpE
LTAEELIQSGQVDEALAALQDGVRKKPADARLRRFLFQLLCIMGRWDKALTQLQVLADMDVESMLLAQIFRPVIGCETLRAEVFEGKRTALIFGEPEEWVSWAVQAHTLAARGEFSAASEMQRRAFEAAPATPGRVNDTEFEWIADADSRLGPLLEAYIDSKYYWIPMHRIQRVVLEKPTDLRDLIWISAKFSWTNGGESAGFIPVRYPGSESLADGGIRLSRKTEWTEKAPDYYFGVGQRMFATDAADIPLLEVKTIEFAGAPQPAEAEASVEAPPA